MPAPILAQKNRTRLSKSQTKKKIDKGVKWVNAGRLDRACEFWNQAYNIHKQGYALNYLMGVCAELSGNLEEALSFYHTADRQTGSPNEEINKALGRVKVNIKKQKKLEQELKM